MIEKLEIPKRMDEYGHYYQEASSIEWKINELIEEVNALSAEPVCRCIDCENARPYKTRI